MPDNKSPYTVEEFLFEDGKWQVNIFKDRGDIVTMPVRVLGDTKEKALENAKTEFLVYLEKEFREGKVFVDKLNQLIAEEQLK